MYYIEPLFNEPFSYVSITFQDQKCELVVFLTPFSTCCTEFVSMWTYNLVEIFTVSLAKYVQTMLHFLFCETAAHPVGRRRYVDRRYAHTVQRRKKICGRRNLFHSFMRRRRRPINTAAPWQYLIRQNVCGKLEWGRRVTSGVGGLVKTRIRT